MREQEKDTVAESVVIGHKEIVSNETGWFTLEEVFYHCGGKALALAAQRGGGSPTLETSKVRLEGLSAPDVAVGVPVHCRGVGPDGLKGPFQLRKMTKLTSEVSFCG